MSCFPVANSVFILFFLSLYSDSFGVLRWCMKTKLSWCWEHLFLQRAKASILFQFIKGFFRNFVHFWATNPFINICWTSGRLYSFFILIWLEWYESVTMLFGNSFSLALDSKRKLRSVMKNRRRSTNKWRSVGSNQHYSFRYSLVDARGWKITLHPTQLVLLWLICIIFSISSTAGDIRQWSLSGAFPNFFRHYILLGPTHLTFLIQDTFPNG